MIAQWIRAGVCAGAGLALAWLAAVDAIAQNTMRVAPDTALWYQPDNAVALVAKSEKLLSENPEKPPLVKIAALARTSLQHQALGGAALRALAIAGDEQKAEPLMLLSQKVTRRDFLAQLWLIEKQIEKNELDSALGHYDTALSISQSGESGGSALLLPILTEALDDPAIRASFAKLIRTKPVWLPQLLGYAISSTKNPENVADLLIQAGPLPAEPDYRMYETGMLSRLASSVKPQETLRYYLALRGGNKNLVNDPRFLAANVSPVHAPIHWSAIANDAIEGKFVDQGKDEMLALEAYSGSGARGLVAYKMTFFPTGTYSIREGKRPQNEASSAYGVFEIACRAGAAGNSIWKSRFSEFAKAPAISIPTNCPVQELRIWVETSDGAAGAAFLGSPLISKAGA